jgi:serine protease AprX
MKKFILLLALFISAKLFAQVGENKYLIRFTDKNNSPYSVSNPSEFLSLKAIARRSTQNIQVVQNDIPVNPAYIDSVANTGVTILANSKWFNSVTIATSDTIALNRIYSFPFVLQVDSVARVSKPNPKVATIVQKQAMSSNSFSQIPYASKLNSGTAKTQSYDYGMASNQITMIGGDYLHNQGYHGENITIAVIDAGFWYVDTLSVFDSLWANNQILAYKDFVEPGGNVFRKSTHGMMVLSIMGGNKPGQIIGTAPKANYLLLRSEDVNSEYIIEEYNWASAAEFADSAGADVINSSLGYTTFDAAWQDHTYAQLDGNSAPATIAADIAASKGIIVCNSAGNSGNDTWHYISAPADADSILTVGAVNNLGIYSSFSSTGFTTDGRIKPTVSTQGQDTWVASTNGGIQSGNGTSFSSPVLAGATACLLQANPGMTNMEIIHAINESASQYAQPDSLMGYGIPNFAAANLLLSGIIINNFDNDNLINIFPNPFDDNINIVFVSTNTQSVTIELYNFAGEKVAESAETTHPGYNNYSLGLASQLSNGLYILQIRSNKNTYTHKLVKKD